MWDWLKIQQKIILLVHCSTEKKNKMTLILAITKLHIQNFTPARYIKTIRMSHRGKFINWDRGEQAIIFYYLMWLKNPELKTIGRMTCTFSKAKLVICSFRLLHFLDISNRISFQLSHNIHSLWESSINIKHVAYAAYKAIFSNCF